ncbi:hypothetical protein Taro_023624 [Colocasia esculenta]|uniref:Amine oxidase n=1 Tax=Colocasia esculenta TaxID=4460 RepID=A0A843VF23_COLES|nr:hypothetical protein [Colocasia esculenta]
MSFSACARITKWRRRRMRKRKLHLNLPTHRAAAIVRTDDVTHELVVDLWEGKAICFYQNGIDNIFSCPIEGVFTLIDVDAMEITGYSYSLVALLSVAKGTSYYRGREGSQPQWEPKPIGVFQLEGHSFTIDGHQVEWGNWVLHIALDTHVNPVVLAVSFYDTSKGEHRPMLYQSHTSETFIPYMDLLEERYYQTYLELGNYGFGQLTFPLAPLDDCPRNATYLDDLLVSTAESPSKTAMSSVSLRGTPSHLIVFNMDAREFVVEGHSMNRPPFFDGTDYPYWKNMMMVFLRAQKYEVWRIVEKELVEVTGDEDTWTAEQIIRATLNYTAMNFLECAIHPQEYSRISMCKSAKEMWDKLELLYEGTFQVQETKANMLVSDYELFVMKYDENISNMFARFMVIINGLRDLGKEYSNEDLSKFEMKNQSDQLKPKVEEDWFEGPCFCFKSRNQFFCFSSKKKTLMAKNSSSNGSSKVLKTSIASDLGAICWDEAFYRSRLEYSGVLEEQMCVLKDDSPKAKWIRGRVVVLLPSGVVVPTSQLFFESLHSKGVGVAVI